MASTTLTASSDPAGSSTIDDTSSQDDYASQGMIKYNMFYTTSRSNARLHRGSSSTPAIYYMESELFTVKPWILLRRGDSKTSPMFAFVKLSTVSRHMLVGRGDCFKDPEGQLSWDKLEREKNLLLRSDYHFGTCEGSAKGQLQRFTWKKDKSALGKTVYVCVDESDRLIGSLRSGGMFNWGKGGEVEVLESLNEALKEILLAAALGVWMMEFGDFRSLLQGYKSGDT